MTSRDQRVSAATDQLREFMNSEFAASKIELEAKLIEAYYNGFPFEPHHLHDALQYLAVTGELERVTEPTRGGRRPPLWVVADTKGRSRKVADASARKRLLMSRYYSYVEGGEEGTSLAGPAGELAFQAAFQRTTIGASLADFTRGRPEVPTILNQPVPMGPLDNAFVLTCLDRNTNAPVPPWGVQALVEVKNIREWVYPRTQELYQVLYKAAAIQRAHPEASILPVLVCRRAHITTKFMAKDLGFYVITALRQFLPESSLIDPDHLAELGRDLGILDLVQGDDTAHTRHLETGLRSLQRKFDVQAAIENWKIAAADDEIFDAISELVRDDLPNPHRDHYLQQLREAADMLDMHERGW